MSRMLWLGLGLTFLTVGFGSVLAALLFGRRYPEKPFSAPPQFEILIPAHNEELKIGLTLESLFRVSANQPIRVQIALDDCSDQTAQKVEPWKTILPIETVSVDFRSKWKTLRHLVERVGEGAEWIVLVDAGAVLDPRLFKEMGEAIASAGDLAVIGPSYNIEGGSSLQKIFWKIESTLKRLENRLRGPISFHGATFAFKKEVLKKVFHVLGAAEPWGGFRNDDVILPLAARVLFPGFRSYYLASASTCDRADLERVGYAADFRRRKRMLLGNLQWIRWFGSQSGVSWTVRTVVLRRMLRPFWMVSLLLLCFGLCLRSGVGAWGLLVLLPALLFPAAALASLQAPWAWFARVDQKTSDWR